MRRLRLSQRAISTPSSPIRKLAFFAQQAEQRGVNILRLNIGQPDIPTPPEFFNSMKKFNNAVLEYGSSEGDVEIRREWSKYIKRVNNLDIPPEHFQITVGASEALIFAFMTCCDPGDEVIVFDPTYANYIGFAAISGVNLVPVRCELDSNFKLPEVAEIEKHISNRTRAILLCSPNNPTGTVYSDNDLKLLLEICEENNIFLVVDETYREIVFDDRPFYSIFNVAPSNERVIVVDSLSKRFSLCGARLGCLITSNNDVRKAILNIAQARLAPPTVEQFAAAEMLSILGAEQIEKTKKTYQVRRQALFESYREISGVSLLPSMGAFYSMVELPIEDATDFCRFMLTDFVYNGKTIFFAPGDGFFIESGRGKNMVRVAYVLEPELLIESANLLDLGLKSYRKNYI
jgi:aspartate aminotransferase